MLLGCDFSSGCIKHIYSDFHSSLWINLCDSRIFLLEKVLLHILHVKHLSFVWISLCLIKEPFCENDLSHISQENVFSPVWTLLWIISILLLAHERSHISQEYVFALLYGFSWFLVLISELSQEPILFPPSAFIFTVQKELKVLKT